MSKPKWHRDIPWKAVMGGYRWFRRQFFQAPRPETRYWKVGLPPTPGALNAERRQAQVNRLTRAFGSHAWAPGWRYSYDKGEDLNLRYVYYEKRDEHPDVQWWQDHLRVWVQEDGTAHLGAHYEPKPEEHPKAHLDGVGWDRKRAMSDVATILGAEGIDYERIEWPENMA